MTPSPESITVPVSVRSALSEVHDAASASTACTAMYRPGTLKLSNMISAVYSRFSGAFSGGSVCSMRKRKSRNPGVRQRLGARCCEPHGDGTKKK